MNRCILFLYSILLFSQTAFAQPVIVDLPVGGEYGFQLANGEQKQITLLAIHGTRDTLRDAVREASVSISIDGEQAVIPVARYAMPRIVNGVKVDASLTRGFVDRSIHGNVWNFDAEKNAARLRFWNPDAPLVDPDLFTYPVEQRWFASDTQMANEESFVNGDEIPASKGVYYHYGLDFGGYDGMVRVFAASDGEVLSAGEDVLPIVKEMPWVSTRYDVIYLRGDNGWTYRYSHHARILPNIRPGVRVHKGDWIGVLGKEGASGGWAHLHFEIRDERGAVINAYPFMMETYLREHPGSLLAVARPHHLAAVGEPVRLDGSESICDGGRIESYQWQFIDGSVQTGPIVKRVYDRPGTYSEILRVRDGKGREDVDFCVIQVIDPQNPVEKLPPTMNLACYPTTGIKTGDEVFFKVRTFRVEGGAEAIDFGDGTFGKTRSQNDFATVSHHYDKLGLYIVTAARQSNNGVMAIARVKVIVE